MSFERGQIVWLNFTPHKGHERAGRRPALVISPAVYNAISNCILVCPIASNVTPWPWKVALPEGEKITGAVLVDQIKSIDAAAREIEDANQNVPTEIMDNILARLATLTAHSRIFIPGLFPSLFGHFLCQFLINLGARRLAIDHFLRLNFPFLGFPLLACTDFFAKRGQILIG